MNARLILRGPAAALAEIIGQVRCTQCGRYLYTDDCFVALIRAMLGQGSDPRDLSTQIRDGVPCMRCGQEE